MNAEGGLPWEYLENAQSCVPLLVLLLLNYLNIMVTYNISTIGNSR